MPTPLWYFFVALPCEAKPLIAHFKLKKEMSISAFAIYRNAHITLTVTGPGKSAMAAGVAYSLAAFPNDTASVLLNIGIAGHGSHKLGSIFAAEKIIDHDSECHYYPQLVSAPPCPAYTITTVAKAQLNYLSDTLYEMEASSFYETATRFSSSELIQCIKIISDNKQHSSKQINSAQVSQYIQDHIPLIADYAQQLTQLASIIQPVDLDRYPEIIETWHFTDHEKLLLKRLLLKRALLIKHQPLDLSAAQAVSAKSILKNLREEISMQRFGGF